MEKILTVLQGQFELQRLPYRKLEKLRAWDAADEYLLEYVGQNFDSSPDLNTLILNDGFGALTVALHEYKPCAISDSWLSQQATRQNLKDNHFSEDEVTLAHSLNWPGVVFGLVLIKVPKTMAFFEDQLIRLQHLINQETVIIAAGMVKSMPATAWKLMEQYLGPTRPSLAKKKARLIIVEKLNSPEVYQSPYPSYYQLENTSYRIVNHANVFSRESLDIGTRFFLQHLPMVEKAKDIVDLGCGNGVVGLMISELHPDATIHFVDESYMAIASAKDNFYHAFPDRQAVFNITDGLTEFKDHSADLVLCNPPFHQQNTIGNQIAISMFKQSRRVLKQGGELYVIGNRHLAYHIDLKRLFGKCKEIASNQKFVIWQVKKSEK